MNEVSSSALPFSVLAEIEELVPELTLVGSFARDYWVHYVAGLPLGALTLDIDVTILVTSMAEYRERLRPLDGPTGVGMSSTCSSIRSTSSLTAIWPSKESSNPLRRSPSTSLEWPNRRRTPSPSRRRASRSGCPRSRP